MLLAASKRFSQGVTPDMMHLGQADVITQQRQAVLTTAYLAHPERFVPHPPSPPVVPTAVWINPPMADPSSQAVPH